MSSINHEIEIRAGRRDADGLIRLSIFAEELLAFTLEDHGERAHTLLLTLKQARALQSALAELIPLLDSPQSRERTGGPWRGEDRRARVS